VVIDCSDNKEADKLKSNLKICLLISGLLILVLGLAACGRTSVPDDRVNTIPHDVDWGFTNCLVCHSGGDIALPAVLHPTNPTNEECLNPGCHSVATPTQTIITPAPQQTTTTPPVSTPPVSTPPVSTTTTTVPPPLISAEFHPGLKDVTLCFICHVGEEGKVVDPWPASHAEEGRTNDSCLDDGCHEFQ